MEFLYRNNRSVWNSGNRRSCIFWVEKLRFGFGHKKKDLLLLDTIKNSIDAKNLSWNSVRVIFFLTLCGGVKSFTFYTKLLCIFASRNSITHNATVMAHGLMQCGTTSDVFLRPDLRSSDRDILRYLWYICDICDAWGKNLEWLAKASNWAKFSATASLGLILCVFCSSWEFLIQVGVFTSGVIHKGHIKESRRVCRWCADVCHAFLNLKKTGCCSC